MLIPDPDFYPYRTRNSDPTTATKEEGEKILLSKIWVWDPGSGKNLSRFPDPGVKKN
jgi:hypothetical protein